MNDVFATFNKLIKISISTDFMTTVSNNSYIRFPSNHVYVNNILLRILAHGMDCVNWLDTLYASFIAPLLSCWLDSHWYKHIRTSDYATKFTISMCETWRWCVLFECVYGALVSTAALIHTLKAANYCWRLIIMNTVHSLIVFYTRRLRWNGGE